MRSICFVSAITLLLAFSIADAAPGDELTQMVQLHLVELGYEPGDTTGDMTVGTAVAISKFQAQNDLPVTGEVSPQLAGILSAKVDAMAEDGESTTVAAVSGANAEKEPAAEAEVAAVEEEIDPEVLKKAQEDCLKEKVAEAQAKRKKQRGIGSLLSAVSRTAGQIGSDDIARSARTVNDANATAADLSRAAEDLGLTEDDIEACQNPF